MRLEVLGNSAGVPAANGATTGYLLTEGDSTVLIDCGMGVAARLRAVLPLSRLTGIVISHLHADHMHDLLPLAWILRVERERPRDSSVPPTPPLPLCLPPGGAALLRAWDSLFPISSTPGREHAMRTEFVAADYDPAGSISVGGFTVRFAAMRHTIPAYGLRLSAGGKTLAFSADTGPTPALVELARGADALLCDSTYLEPEPGAVGHLTAREAAEAAGKAGARRLWLTHLRGHEPGWLAALRDSAAAVFDGPIETCLPRHGYEC